MATAHERVSSPPAGPVPKAVLYYQEKEVWSSSVLLTLLEKGYNDDELDKRTVDTYKGENFELAYLRINGAGAVPTLVVPMDRYIGPEIESRYKSVSDIVKVLDFLDQSRTTVSKTHTTSHQPAPALAPATIDTLSKSNVIINLVHSPSMDLEFLFLSALTTEELVEKAKGVQGDYVKARTAKLEKALSPNTSSPDPNDPLPALTARSRSQLEVKFALHKGYSEVYSATDLQSAAVQEWLAKSKKTWEVEIKEALDTVEKTIKQSHVAVGEEPPPATIRVNGELKPGGLVLGEQLALADLHFFPWLARAVYLAGGDNTPDGIEKLQVKIGGPVGERVKAFWTTMLERDSVKTVYKDGLH